MCLYFLPPSRRAISYQVRSNQPTFSPCLIDHDRGSMAWSAVISFTARWTTCFAIVFIQLSHTGILHQLYLRSLLWHPPGSAHIQNTPPTYSSPHQHPGIFDHFYHLPSRSCLLIDYLMRFITFQNLFPLLFPSKYSRISLTIVSLRPFSQLQPPASPQLFMTCTCNIISYLLSAAIPQKLFSFLPPPHKLPYSTSHFHFSLPTHTSHVTYFVSTHLY